MKAELKYVVCIILWQREAEYTRKIITIGKKYLANFADEGKISPVCPL